MTDPIPAIIMLSPWGSSEAERWMATARAAAASDLVSRLRDLPQYDPILLLAADESDVDRLTAAGATPIPYRQTGFHFGRVLAETVRTQGLDRLAYFGGASAPLVHAGLLRELAERLGEAGARHAVVNNLHSTDWGLIDGSQPLLSLRERLPLDNALGWVLKHEAGYAVTDLPPTAASRLDLDTPTDILMASGHPDAGPQLTKFLGNLSPNWLERRERIQTLLATPAGHLTLIGRVLPRAWIGLGRKTQLWIRVFAEERGMIASGRHAADQVRSLIHELVGVAGAAGFAGYLAELADGVLWDTRVWMSARGGWPSAADRFAADLVWPEAIADPTLRELTQAIEAAPIPIMAGGHGVVAGGLLAMLECMHA